MIKAIIFDRDGTLNKSMHQNSHGYVLNLSEMELLPFVKEGLELAKQKGLDCYVFTQQRCINKGLVTENILTKIHHKMSELLGKKASIKKYYHCPHLANEGCECSKPKPGMILDILKEQNLKPQQVIVMGDAMRDYESAKNAKVPFVFIKSPKHTDDEYAKTGVKVYNNILDAVESL